MDQARDRDIAGRTRSRRPGIAVLVVATVLAATACSGDATSDGSAPTTEPLVKVGPASFHDELTPLIVTTLGSDAIPVPGSDGRVHVAYELSVLNFAHYPAVITHVDTVSPAGDVVTSRSQGEVRALTMVVPELSVEGAPATGIPAGRTALLILEDVYPDRASVPESVTHRISATFAPVDGEVDPRAGLWPPDVVQTGGLVVTSSEEPVVLGAPLSGRGWVVGNGCCGALNFHRNVMLPVGGAVNAGERFAIDFTGITPGLAAGAPLAADMVFEPGTDGTMNEDYVGYGAPVLAVADATVVKVIADRPDTPPGRSATGEGLSLDALGGNMVVLQLAPDLFAFSFHLAPGSPMVEVGDDVTKGQQIGELGNSGNSTAPHLHFQLSRSPRAFTAENVPFVFEDFEVIGTLTDTSIVAEPAPGPRQDELPLTESLVDFPGTP
jgi:hypothetical protein